ncbi:hypothetical protein [Pontimicrobium aquaticum]|uniref:DUF481 domain-containing protein n=1 Tax=Pontimicrobium aquaticum TaxID=2565367 RepID=A0A4U0F0W6_9FLAO|nr:hypothetical protein [Pontimicrobium aquaticum]TJY38026.1 hypothetical protein E5167_01855 [Pontimicrobium aquaticum]
MSKSFIALIIMCLTFSFQSNSQETPQNDQTEDLKIYLDCRFCDNTFLKQNLGNVQFVRDQAQGDVHLFFLAQGTGSGGRRYDVDFIGKNDFESINYKLSFTTDSNMTGDDVRKRILEKIKLGLVRFWIEKGTLDGISVSAPTPKVEEAEKTKTEVEDPWNSWFFRLGANGWFNGQETNNSSNINLNISARRVTEKNKFFMRIGFNENKSTFSYNGDDIVSINSGKSLYVNDVLSINDHWSYGFFGGLGTSTFGNYALYWNFKPALEYNFFKYNESANKQLVLSYSNGIRYNDYTERTVFLKNSEYLWEHSISLGGSVRQEWGDVNGEISFDQYLHDTTLNSLNFNLRTNIRLFKGFNFNIGGGYSITRNQINISSGGASLEDILLRQQQLQSGYNYFFNVGISYSFGSIYNTVVNPRFNF